LTGNNNIKITLNFHIQQTSKLYLGIYRWSTQTPVVVSGQRALTGKLAL